METYWVPMWVVECGVQRDGCISMVKAADAQATVAALQRERDEWRSNAVAQEVRANDLERDCKDLLSDIDGERAKVGDLLKKIAYWEKRHRTYRELAEENMNCKQAALDALKDAYDELERQHADLRSAFNAEREKVKGLHEITKVICTHCCEPMEIPSKAVLQTQLTQLQALVRAISETMEPFRKSLAKLDEVDTLATRRIAEADAYYCAQRALATLDATTPDSNQLGDINDMVSKGGNGE